jgi:MerR family Zn(II)-responsive transcriptional regulator of zntA
MRYPESDRERYASSGGLMKIGQFAKKLNLTPRAVRYYESLGLVEPCGRTDGGFRLYGPREFELLLSVLSFKELGLSLVEIRNLVQNAGDECEARQVFNRVLQELTACDREITRKIDSLAEVRREVRRAWTLLESCTGCEGKPFDIECLECWEQAGPVPRPLKVLAQIAIKNDRHRLTPFPRGARAGTR